MNNSSEMLKDPLQQVYYVGGEYAEQIGLIEQKPTVVRKEWTSQTTIWMMVFALLLWLITYLMVMTITMCFDVSFRSMAGFNGLIRWYNGSVPFNSDDHTRFIIAY